MQTSHVRPSPHREVIRVDRAGPEWRYLDFKVLALQAGEELDLETRGRETAMVTIAGSGVAEAGDGAFPLSRAGVFEEASSLLYVGPGIPLRLTATTQWRVAIGSAAATGIYPVRLITPPEMKVEIRGGGTALRQVNHLLAHPLPAERLIVYEVFVPAGTWAGWPPHCHDGRHGSPYLEETYLFHFDRSDGFGFHRNYLHDGSTDEVVTVRDGDCVAVPCGFHVSAAAPGSNMWILNFLAGDLIAEARATPPYFDPTTTWIADDWSGAKMKLPVGTTGLGSDDRWGDEGFAHR